MKIRIVNCSFEPVKCDTLKDFRSRMLFSTLSLTRDGYAITIFDLTIDEVETLKNLSIVFNFKIKSHSVYL